jgi:hypothetical protein
MRLLPAITALICLIGAPLLGIHLSGEPVGDYLDFPPVSVFPSTDPAPFSWAAFIFISLLIIAVMAPFIIKVVKSQKSMRKKHSVQYGFPGWGWIGLFILAAGWVFAWTRFPWFSNLQAHTFSLPWIGYIILVNAFTWMRSGRSMITHQTGYLIMLFILSAVFWWYFEYLNQFVRNWYYVNVENLGRTEYFIHATLPFSTVLPAVIGTRDLLYTFPRVSAGLDDFFRIRAGRPGQTAFIAATIAITGLVFTGLWPEYAYPMLWIAPLVMIAAAVVISRGETVYKDLIMGDWRNIYLLALSALICGFFWEMWNYYSFTRWEYSVPLVARFYVFEMPLLGYAGYLPFGLQCGLAAWLVRKTGS